MPTKNQNPTELAKKIKTTFKNERLLEEALTHRSYLNENSKWPIPHNERLEFLGDAVLELVVTDHLYQTFPEKPEGELTSIRAALVNHLMLSRVANDIDLDDFILLSRGEAKDTGRAREAILSNAVEAIIGAIYLDQNYRAADRFIEKYLLKYLDEVMEEELFVDAKSQLQELVQERQKITPTYRVLKTEGPDHAKKFTVGTYRDKTLIAKGSGLSKQDAERNAAENALKKLS
jgi:ribonuclease III